MAFDADTLRSYGYDENTIQAMAQALGEPYTPPQQGAGTATSYAPGSLQMIPQADGSYQAINPRTGQAEVVYNDNDTSQMYFPSDGQVPASAQPAGAPTYHSDTGFGTLDEFLSRVIPGALAAIPAAASFAAAPAAVAGTSSAADLGAAGASAGYTNLPIAAAPAATSNATLEAILSGAGAAAPSAAPAVSDATLQAILDSASVPTAAEGVQVAGPTEAAAGSFAPTMPAAVPEVDPTFGGALTQTGAGQFENLAGQFGGTALPAAGGAAAGSLASPLLTGAGTAAGAEAVSQGVNTGNNTPTAPAPAPDPNGPVIGNPDPNAGSITGATVLDPTTGLPTVSGTKTPTSIGGTKLSDILSGNVSPEDLAKTLTVGDLSKILGTGLATAGSVAADQQRTDALKELNDKYMAIGAPSRDRYEASYAPGFDINSLPGLQGALDTSTQSILRGLSTNGNPFGNPGGLAEALKYVTGNVALPALNQYRNQNAATGGYGAFSTAAPSAATGAINASGDIYSDLGRGIGNITNPTSSLEQLLKQIKGSGVSVGGLT